MRGRAGYSLFEVLIAFAIMSLVLSALLPGQTRLLERVQSADEQVLATDYAISLADLAVVTPPTQWRNATYDYRDWQVEQLVRQDVEGRPRISIRILSQHGGELATIESLGHTE